MLQMVKLPLITRNSKKGKTLEMQVMGTGYDALLRNFGLNIKKVHNAWLIRENDTYVPSEYVGLTRTEPTWKLGGKDKKRRKWSCILLNYTWHNRIFRGRT